MFTPAVIFLIIIYIEENYKSGGHSVDNKVIGIVAEYNPLHKGHTYLLQEARKKCGNKPIIAAMSGDFVQRGEPALLDKWTRAKVAVASGVDLVLELPTVFCVRSAEYFALGGVKVLAATGVVDQLVFGVETMTGFDADMLAAYLNSPEATIAFKKIMQEKHNYGAAWQQVAEDWHKGAGACLSGPNNILSMSYRRAIHLSKAMITAVPILRQGNADNDTSLTSQYPSATALRQTLYARKALETIKDYVPAASLAALAENYPFREPIQSLKMLLAYELLYCNANQMYDRTISDTGLCFRMLKSRTALQNGWENYLGAVVNKRYPKPSLRRIILQLLLHETREFWQETNSPAYLRVLAFNERGRSVLREMKNKAKLPIITKTGNLRSKDYDANFNRQLALDIRAANLYQLLQYHFGDYSSDYTSSPYFLK
jgi:predicted nucleotidyltransferase